MSDTLCTHTFLSACLDNYESVATRKASPSHNKEVKKMYVNLECACVSVCLLARAQLGQSIVSFDHTMQMSDDLRVRTVLKFMHKI